MREQEILHLANLWRVPPNTIRRLSEDRRSLLLQLTIQYGVVRALKEYKSKVIKKDLSPIKWVKNHKL